MKTYKSIYGLGFILSLLVCLPLHAQQQSTTSELRDTLVKEKLETLDSGAADSSISADTKKFRISLGEENKEVSYEWGDFFHSESGYYLNIKATVPLEDAEEGKTTGNLSELNNKAKVSMKWQKVNIPEVFASQNTILKTIKVCQDYLNSLSGVDGGEVLDSARAKNILGFELGNLISDLSSLSIAEQNSEIDQRGDASKLDAANGSCSPDLVQSSKRFTKSFKRALLKPDDYQYYLYGLETTIAAKKYGYYDESDLGTKINDLETEYQIKLYAGKLLTSGARVSGSIFYQDAFTAQDEKNLCDPFGDTGVLQCQGFTVGAPEREKSTSVALSYAKVYSNGVGMELKVTRNLDKDVTGVSLPVWFDNLGGDKLNSGVRLDWDSENDDATLSFFFNVPYSFGN